MAMNRDEIEERIIRAYIRLVFVELGVPGYRTVTVTRLNGLEVRLTEQLPAEVGVPPYSLEIYSETAGCIINSCDCTEFDEDEMTAAVEMIASAQCRLQYIH